MGAGGPIQDLISMSNHWDLSLVAELAIDVANYHIHLLSPCCSLYPLFVDPYSFR